MAKPAYWVVFIPGAPAHKFTRRATMRAYVALQKALGQKPIIKAVGF